MIQRGLSFRDTKGSTFFRGLSVCSEFLCFVLFCCFVLFWFFLSFFLGGGGGGVGGRSFVIRRDLRFSGGLKFEPNRL